MKNKPTLVVALGGNALLKRGDPLEAEIQQKNILTAAEVIAGLTADWRVVLVHGNGPQVGLLALQNAAYPAVKPYPLDVLGAETQGMIGYMLQQALKNCLPHQQVTTLLTQVRVDPEDPAFLDPCKYIGPMYTEEQAIKLSAEKHWAVKPDGSGFRRVVASPQPVSIVENAAITALLAEDHLVICNGGGGIPVTEHGQGLQGVEAVIDKDLSAAMLARQLKADALLILTDADAVYLNWNTPAQKAIGKTSVSSLEELQFDAGSMGPKVSACCRFVRDCQGIAGIGSLQDGRMILNGKKGTLIMPG
ncbi:carbamate kinase [Tatumella morbirosei]|uniref:Carbamate kinase n=1 Tax=Tatumella morbirosei TaxID=642227 RepID=A0A095TIV7_9GAMM|nr:carbamate kinase [Tatumella morbirosei]KGD76642.1 carbamate kinase [Tatumella morbirosei]